MIREKEVAVPIEAIEILLSQLHGSSGSAPAGLRDYFLISNSITRELSSVLPTV